ncbi:Mu transposase domain-containing protein [Streptomyces flaveolus]
MSLRLPLDHYVRLDTCDYSVHPLAISRRIESADLDQVLASCTLTDPDHAATAAAARAAAARRPVPTDEFEVEQRSLDTYERIFGVRRRRASEEGAPPSPTR